MEVEVEVKVEVEGNAEVLGSGRPSREKGREGRQVSSLLLKEMPLAVYGFKKGIFD